MTFNESALVKYDGTIISLSRGQPSQVEFDFEKVWNFKRSLGKDFYPELLAFWHVHPPGFLTYSALDVECLKGFNIAFGYPVFFGIITFDTPDFQNAWYQEVAFRYQDGEMKQVSDYTDSSLMPRDVIFLKGVSYAVEVMT